MPPVLRSATKSQSAKAAGVTATTDSGRPVKSRGGRSQNTKRDDEQDPASSHENQNNEPSHLSSDPTPDDHTQTSQSNEGARAHDPDRDSSHQVSETAGAAPPPKTLSAEERIKLKKEAQAKYLKRWGRLLGQSFDYDEATEWEESFTIDVLDKLGRDGGSKKTSGKDENQEERVKRREEVVKKYLKKWNGMLGMCHDYPECDELYKEFEEWMKGMEGVLDELMN